MMATNNRFFDVFSVFFLQFYVNLNVIFTTVTIIIRDFKDKKKTKRVGCDSNTYINRTSSNQKKRERETNWSIATRRRREFDLEYGYLLLFNWSWHRITLIYRKKSTTYVFFFIQLYIYIKSFKDAFFLKFLKKLFSNQLSIFVR